MSVKLIIRLSSLKTSLCLIIPVYNHSDSLPTFVTKIIKRKLPVILVDDGSDKSCKQIMQELEQVIDDVTLKSHPMNLGKGAAVKTGLQTAMEAGFSHALQIDADGQHNIDDIPHFIGQMYKQPSALICGFPNYDKTVPKLRYYSRYATHLWVWINTLSGAIKDSMCGFRIYPVKQSCELLSAEKMGDRMEFDTEFIVRWHWSGAPIVQIQTNIIYPDNGVSHFNLFRDNLLISWMHTRLFFGMLKRLPKLIKQKISNL